MIASNFSRLQKEIRSLAGSRDVKLIGASKTVSADRIREAYDAGMRSFGENRIQEAISKIEKLPADIEWHFIGHLQSNKAKEAVRYFSWIHSVDSVRLLTVLNKEAEKQQKQIRALIEINLGNEETKHGAEPAQLADILKALEGLEYIQVSGLMAIPPFFNDPEMVRPYFRRLRDLAATDAKLTELSMGMSHDYAVAVEEGATMVRIGTALFGERPART